MASFRKQGDKYRAEIARHGVRKSKGFKTLEQAEAWAAITESRIEERQAESVGLRDAVLARLIPQRIADAIEDTEHRRPAILAASVSCERLGGIYFLINKGEVVYVGRTANFLRRVIKHQVEMKKAFDAFSFLPAGPGEAAEIEKKYILALMPLHNQAL